MVKCLCTVKACPLPPPAAAAAPPPPAAAAAAATAGAPPAPQQQTLQQHRRVGEQVWVFLNSKLGFGDLQPRSRFRLQAPWFDVAGGGASGSLPVLLAYLVTPLE
jgi:hypothetical protein